MYQKSLKDLERNPQPTEIRKDIENISGKKVRIAHIYQFITGTRVSEVCGKWAIRLQDVNTAVFYDRVNSKRYPAMIFSQRSAKIGGQQRIIAIPMNSRFEPWIEQLAKYIESRKDQGLPSARIFRVATRTMKLHSQQAFSTRDLWIEKYKDVPGHWKGFSNHGLRHIRKEQLELEYGFDGMDLTAFFGWTLNTIPGMPRMARRYGSNIYRNWARYFPKLLKPYGEASYEILDN